MGNKTRRFQYHCFDVQGAEYFQTQDLSHPLRIFTLMMLKKFNQFIGIVPLPVAKLDFSDLKKAKKKRDEVYEHFVMNFYEVLSV